MSAAPRPASTVILVRDGAEGLEVFMERRHIQSDFVGGAYVFPGGRVDAADALPEERCRGLDDRRASEALGLPRGGLAFWAAAVRECFEEAGVLLAYPDRGNDLVDFSDEDVEDRFRAHRDRLNDGALTLGQILEREDLLLATDRLHYWSHWITPAGQPRRYDTRFFVAEAPPAQTAAHDDWELTASAWVRPETAIEKAQKREWMVIFPTVMTLRELAEFDSAALLLERACAPRDIPACQPKEHEGRVLLPGDEGYETADPDVSHLDPAIWFRAAFER